MHFACRSEATFELYYFQNYGLSKYCGPNVNFPFVPMARHALL